eukprot:11537076-Prorocentrum_lima.AAC.1
MPSHSWDMAETSAQVKAQAWAAEALAFRQEQQQASAALIIQKFTRGWVVQEHQAIPWSN